MGGDGADGVVRRSHAAAIPSGEEATTRTPAPPRSSAGAADSSGRLARAGALVLLVMQMVGLVMLMRYTRTQHPAGAAGSLYLASTAVLAMEAMKLAICLAMVARDAGGTAKGLADQLRTHVVASPGEVLRLSVPSLLYTVQNNLLYLALTNLDAATYQVCYQLKILTTAVFSALMLGRRFSTRKWAAIVLLTLGVIVVQLSGSGDSRGASVAAAAASTEDEDRTARERLVGLAAVLCAACTSGFSGVYFEKILKGSSTPLWIRNIQMGLPSVAIALITVFYKDSAAVFEAGFFQGYTPLVWLVVAVQAAGGAYRSRRRQAARQRRQGLRGVLRHRPHGSSIGSAVRISAKPPVHCRDGACPLQHRNLLSTGPETATATATATLARGKQTNPAH